MRKWFVAHKGNICLAAVLTTLGLTVMGCCCNGTVLVLLLGK